MIGAAVAVGTVAVVAAFPPPPLPFGSIDPERAKAGPLKAQGPTPKGQRPDPERAKAGPLKAQGPTPQGPRPDPERAKAGPISRHADGAGLGPPAVMPPCEQVTFARPISGDGVAFLANWGRGSLATRSHYYESNGRPAPPTLGNGYTTPNGLGQ